MEKLLMNPYDKEYMKMAMLKHEETFREQVYELHRLYQIQKILMKNMGIRKLHGTCFHQDNINSSSNNNNNNNNIPKRPRQCDLDSDHPAASGIVDIINEDETDLELTLGPANQYCSSRRRKKKNSIGSDSAVAAGSFSSSSTGSSRIIIKRANSEEEQVMIRQDRHVNPPWLFHALSLNTS